MSFLFLLIVLLNSVRTQSLTLGPLQKEAQKHAVHMAEQEELSHNQNLSKLRPNSRQCRIGEVVGVVVSTDGAEEELVKAFMDSPSHRKVLIDDDWSTINIGVSSKKGRVYVSVLYLRC